MFVERISLISDYCKFMNFVWFGGGTTFELLSYQSRVAQKSLSTFIVFRTSLKSFVRPQAAASTSVGLCFHVSINSNALNAFLRIWNSSEAFESNWWRKCLWDGCAREPFLPMNSKLLLSSFRLLLLSVVFYCYKCELTAPKAERQLTSFNSCQLPFAYSRRFT